MNRRMIKKMCKRASGLGYLTPRQNERRINMVDCGERRRLDRLQSAGYAVACVKLGTPYQPMRAALREPFALYGIASYGPTHARFGRIRVKWNLEDLP